MLSASFLLIIPIMKIILSIFTFILLFASYSHAAEENEVAASTAQPSLAEIPRTEPNIEQNQIQELLKFKTPDTEILQLDTGKEGEQLIAFYQTEGSGIKQGGIIMFPDQNTHMDWPDNLNSLREGLSNYGWYTLSIYLPRPKKDKIPKRTLPVLSAINPAQADTQAAQDDESEQPAETEDTNDSTPAEPTEETQAETPTDKAETPNEEPEETYAEKSDRLGSTAIAHMVQTESLSRFIVMGIGTGAVWAAKYVEQHEEEQDLRLVMINARNPQKSDAPDLLALLPEISSTIIDLHHSTRGMDANNFSPESPARRLRLARQKRMNNFHQSRMPATSDNWKRNNSWLLKHTRGMINTYIIKAEQAQRSIELNDKATQNKEKAPG